MTSPSFARAAASSNNRTKLFLGTVCAVLLATATVEAKSYKGAEVDSMKSFLYGRMEMRMRMIRGGGLISTFFTYKTGSELSGAFWEEIDIEVFGKDGAKSWQSNIMSNFPRDHSEETHPVENSLADDYHTFTLEWAPDYISWLFDGKEVRRTEGGQAKDLTHAETLRFNAWSSEVASWAGEFDESVLPAYQFVNWIKYYRYEDGKFVWDWTDEFDSWDDKRWSKATWTFDQNRVDFDPANAVVKDGALILAITKEGATGFTGSVPVDPEGGAGPGSTHPPIPTGGTSGSSSSSSGSAGGSSSSNSSEKPADASGCSYAGQIGSGGLAMLLFGLTLLGLRSRRSRKN